MGVATCFDVSRPFPEGQEPGNISKKAHMVVSTMPMNLHRDFEAPIPRYLEQSAACWLAMCRLTMIYYPAKVTTCGSGQTISLTGVEALEYI